MRPRLGGMLLAGVTTLASSPLSAGSVPDGFVERVLAGGLRLPIAFDFAGPDETIFIAEKEGRIRVLRNGRLLPRPFLDISARVNSRGERGLLGVAVHPEFPSQPYVYVTYTYDPPQTRGRTGAAGPDGDGKRVARLSRFTARSDQAFNRAREDSEFVLLGRNSTWQNIGNSAGGRDGPLSCQSATGPIQDCIPHDTTNHAIGSMKFGSDSALYVSVGDGSYGGDVQRFPVMRVQDVNSPLGKVLRINPETGEGYTDNPFFNGDTAANRSKVWYRGLRNPFRFTLSRSSNRVYVGNVGQSSWEEINQGEAGANFGWPCFEGARTALARHGQFQNHPVCRSLYAQAASVTAPLYAYPNRGGAAIVLGDFAPASWPRPWGRSLFFADHNGRDLSFLRFDSAGNPVFARKFASAIGDLTQIVFFQERMYVTQLSTGQLKTIRPITDNVAPVAVMKTSRRAGLAPLTIRFDGRSSSDVDRDRLVYQWRFGDGQSATGPVVTHRYLRNGRFAARLTVTDSLGLSDTKRIAIIVGDRPPATGFLKRPAQRLLETRFKARQPVVLAGWGRDAEDGVLSGDSLQWTAATRHRQHTHPDLASASGDRIRFRFPDHGDETYVTICLQVRDSANLTARRCLDAKPLTVKVTITSEPPGVLVDYAGLSRRTPFTVDSVVAGDRTVTAPLRLDSGAAFSGWSDGGAASHVIRVPGEDLALRVMYRE